MSEFKSFLEIINLMGIPGVLVWVILVERRLAKIETTCKIRNENKVAGEACSNVG